MGLLFWFATFAVVLMGWHFFLTQIKPQPWKSGSVYQNFWQQLVPILIWQLRLSEPFKKSEEQSLRQNYFRWVHRRINFLLPILTLSFLHLEINPAIFLLLGTLLWVLSHFLNKVEKFSLAFLGLGLTLWAFDSVLRQVSLIFANIESYAFLYVLMENSFISIIYGLTIGAFLAFSSRIQGASLFLAIIGIISGLVSLPVAFGIFIGELIYWIFKDEQLKSFLSKPSIGLDLISTIVCVGLWSLFPVIWNESYSPQLRREQFLVGCSLWVALNLGFRACFYHFKSQSQN